MKEWTHFIVSVNYSPADPGNTTWHSEETRINRDKMLAGQSWTYRNPGDVFAPIKIVEVREDGLVISYGKNEHYLSAEYGAGHVQLDKDGKDYTNFELYVWLEAVVQPENTPEFYRYYLNTSRIGRFRHEDIKLLKESDEPCAKYVLGRWYYCIEGNGEESMRKAEKLLREAAAAGIADAVAMLSVMYFLGDTKEDRVDYDEATRLLEKAIEMGSELAAIKYARHRLYGIYLADEEPDVVAREIEGKIRSGTDISPEWYSVLGDAYWVMDNPKAEQVYKTGIEKGSIRCYGDLAVLYKERGNIDEKIKWMKLGMKKGDSFCYMIDYNYSEEELKRYGKLGKGTYLTTRYNLERGMALGESTCAYILGQNYYYGYMGFSQDTDKSIDYLWRGVYMGNSSSCALMADILETDNPLKNSFKKAAKLRLSALRRGEDSVREKVIQAYHDGLLDEYKNEIEKYWLYDDYEDDDGRWDAYV